MNSCLYRCEVMHHRLQPREHRFSYSIFMFYLDLDELDSLAGKLWLFGHNRTNWFNFKDRDHLRFPMGSGNGHSLKQNVLDYLRDSGISFTDGKIMLLTNVTTLGYGFNPISIYLCFDKAGRAVCSIAEVCNTHGEMKLFLLNEACFSVDTFRLVVPKLFYVSPFADLNSKFDFIFRLPDEGLSMRVDDYENNERFLLSHLSGSRRTLTNFHLLEYGLRFPFITLGIVFLIHWQAFILYLKRIPFHRKNENPHLQQEAYRYRKV